jgi:acylphosphatase
MVKVAVIVEGSIQAVGYRAFVKRSASELGLKGLVRNLPDRKVEIFCDGGLPEIEFLLHKIDYKGKKGDALSAYVEKLGFFKEGEKGYLGPWKEYDGFQIDFGFEVESPIDRALLEHLESGTLYVSSSRDETVAFRSETNSNFERMEEKYGSI